MGLWVVMEETPPDRMYFERIDTVNLFRPRASREVQLRIQAEQNLRSAYKIGRYTDKDTINQILQHQYAFFTCIIEGTLPTIASLDLLEFLLAEYEKTAEIDRVCKQNRLSDDDNKRWAELGPVVRRAMKYMAERIVLLAPRESIDMPTENALEKLEIVWICAEQLVKYYLLSDQTFMIFPDDTVLEIYPEGGYQYLNLTLEPRNQCAVEMQERVHLDTMHRDRFLPGQSFVLDVQEHDRHLKVAFEEAIGISYIDALGCLKALIDGIELPKEGFTIPFVLRDHALDSLSKHLGFPRRSVERVVAGFSISRSRLEAEGREVWKPKQEYRAFRRGILELEHPAGIHWIFSKAMAIECALQLMSGVVFKDLPPEWRSKQIDKALEALSNAAGRRFEGTVLQCLDSVGISGVRSEKNGIGRGSNRIAIPGDVGEIDYLGYSPAERLLVVAECKMVRSGFEPKYFRDEISEFATSKDSYFVKFRKKIDFALNHVPDICRAVASVLHQEDTPINPTRLATAMITFYPTVAACFSNDFPCVTITEIMTGYEGNMIWPYQKGVYPC